jgi:3',5'-cyclic AMP phosphodiesterase CpdA
VKLAWVTDIHLDFVDAQRLDAFGAALESSGADGFLVGGDIAKAPSVEAHLRLLASRLRRPIWFVLGNHDFYLGSIVEVRAAIRGLGRTSEWLRWLPDCGVVSLTTSTALVGCDGWGDARLGNFAATPVQLNDFRLIEELSGLSHADRLRRLRALGDESADRLRANLFRALERFQKIVVLTHVPPFREACWHEGKVSDDDWLPYFTCDAVGEALREAAIARPDRDLTVLCGHTHGSGTAEILANLRVWTGGAAYGRPRIERTIEVT